MDFARAHGVNETFFQAFRTAALVLWWSLIYGRARGETRICGSTRGQVVERGLVCPALRGTWMWGTWWTGWGVWGEMWRDEILDIGLWGLGVCVEEVMVV